VATLPEIASVRTSLNEAEVEHLLRLLASWSLLSDLSFSDMLLLAPSVGHAGVHDDPFVVLAQVRPNNRATLISDDLVGTIQEASLWPSLRQSLSSGVVVRDQVMMEELGEAVPVWYIPVTFDGRVISILVRVQGPLRGPASLYEQAYLNIFERLSTMVTESSFPFRESEVAGPGMPRVGDGIILIDQRGLVEFATPNATNALHRLGLSAATEGRSLRDLGLRVRVVERALEFGLPSMEEVDRGAEVAILFHCVPLIEGAATTGVVVLMRDVTDVRRLNRLVLSKEAAIKEVHHRVKNNLQTISSLLRLQARRSDDGDSRTALLEAERRIRSIAVVHEVLSREPGEVVDFAEIVGSIVTMVEDSIVVEHPVEIMVEGELGNLSTDIATPLAVALAELLTNAVEHAFVEFGDRGDVGIVTLQLTRQQNLAELVIRDNGRGLPADFSLELPTSLGLSIVRDLIRNQLHGTIEMRNGEEMGAYVNVRVPTLDGRL
jgi:two-component sensor histidine kinase